VKESCQTLGCDRKRDLLYLFGLQGENLFEVSVRDVMVTEVETVDEEDDLVECLMSLLDKPYRHLIVMKENKPVGVLSFRSKMLLEVVIATLKNS